MDRLKEVAQALGFSLSVGDLFYQEGLYYLGGGAAPLILVYGKGGIMEKMGWWWRYAIGVDAWKLLNSNGEELLDFHPIDRDPQVVIDAYLKTLPREPELPDLDKWYGLDARGSAEFQSDIIQHINSLTAKVEKLEGK